jgi:hypothetical protein
MKSLKMNMGKLLSVRLLVIALLYFGISIGFMQSTTANTETNSISNNWPEERQIALNSNGFNAQKRSNFNIAGQTEHIERGLTIIHFNTSEKFEYRTFDTYSSEEASQEMIDVLWRMQKNGAVFAILAHDSAANSILKQSEALKKCNFPS